MDICKESKERVLSYMGYIISAEKKGKAAQDEYAMMKVERGMLAPISYTRHSFSGEIRLIVPS